MTAESEWVRRTACESPAERVFVGPRARLLRAGLELLFERRDTSYTIEDLVRRAGVAIKTFYRSFPNKEMFLQEVFIAIVAGAVPAVRECVLASSDDPLERLRNAVTGVLRSYDERESDDWVIANEHMRIASVSPEAVVMADRPFRDFLRELVVDAAAAGQVRPVDLDWDVAIITAMITSSFHVLALGGGEQDRDELAENVWRFCRTALRAPGRSPI